MRDEGAMSVQSFAMDFFPLFLLFAISVTGLALTVSQMWLRGQAFSRNATLLGQFVRAYVDRAVSDDGLATRLREAGFHGPSVRDVRPSLEDVFVALTTSR